MTHLTFITGRPGIGKTSVLLRAVDDLTGRGYRIEGMISREVREGGIRVGFEIVDFCTGRRGWLAHVNQPSGPQVGKYRVNLSDLNLIGASSIRSAVDNDHIVVVDEIGPMELSSQTFRNAILQALESKKAILGTIHHKLADPLIQVIRAKEGAEILEVTFENRAELHKTIVERILSFVKPPRNDQDR